MARKTTEVLLLEDVYKTGVAGEVVHVAAGYARNYLLPNGLGIVATPGALRKMENLRKKAEVRRAEREKKFNEIAGKLQGLELRYGVRAGDTGKLYGSVTPQQIAESIMERLGLEIDRRRIGDKALRELGEFQVPVRLEAGLTPTIKVIIHREGEEFVPEVEEAAEVVEEMAEEAPEAIEESPAAEMEPEEAPEE